MTQLPISKLPG